MIVELCEDYNKLCLSVIWIVQPLYFVDGRMVIPTVYYLQLAGDVLKLKRTIRSGRLEWKIQMDCIERYGN